MLLDTARDVVFLISWKPARSRSKSVLAAEAPVLILNCRLFMTAPEAEYEYEYEQALWSQPHFAIAWRKSAMMSSGSSSPIDTRV